MAYILPQISQEQQFIIDSIKNSNIITNAVAGSGKTSTNLFIATIFRDLKILLLTYNARLKSETREKVNLLGLTNLEVHSYHAFCHKYYDPSCISDSLIAVILEKDLKCITSFNYDIIIIDEAQDCKEILYELICKIARDNSNKSTRFCLLGDKFQNVYKFMGSDSRFLTLANQLFKSNDKWVVAKLSQSFRVTIPMAQFINRCLLHENRIVSTKKSIFKPRYLICDPFGDKNDMPLKEILYYLSLGYKYDDIFVLAPSIKSEKGPVLKLSNKLTALKIPVHGPVSEEEKLQEKDIHGKICLTTIHQSKGLERAVVIVFNFDQGFYFISKNAPTTYCPNEIYVAVTRAKERLSLIHGNKHNYFDFLNKELLNTYCDVIIGEKLDSKINDKNSSKPAPASDSSVTKLLSFLPVEIVNKAMTFFTYERLSKKGGRANIVIPTRTVQDSGLTEAVAEINGIAIPSYLEYKKTNKMSINKTFNYDITNLTPELLLKISNEFQSKVSCFKFKLSQITRYDWLTQKMLDDIYNRISKNISSKSVYEGQYSSIISDFAVRGSIDCIDGDNIWEFKYVQHLDDIHILQLAIYMFLVQDKIVNLSSKIIECKDLLTKFELAKQLFECNLNYKYYLYNFMNNDLIKISGTYENLYEMVLFLIDFKNNDRYYDSTDVEFLAKMKMISNKYNNVMNVNVNININVNLNANLEVNARKHLMVLDLETTGLKYCDKIIQLSYSICDLECNLVESKNIYLNDKSNSVDFYKKISLDTIRKKGIAPKNALLTLIDDLNRCKYIIGHNISFDIGFIKKYFQIHNMNVVIPTSICTMRATKSMVGSTGKKNQLKNPRLGELYSFIFDDEMDEDSSHTADYDTKITHLCLQELIKNTTLESLELKTRM